MDLQQKVNIISLVVMLVCIVLAVMVYFYTGNIFIVILFAPPVVYWIMRKSREG